ncbi:MAG TPA: hypothetical protein VGB91_01465 [Rhizomicrobium sp.]
MEYYLNRAGNSGVSGYELGADSIRVQFRDNSIYLYNYQITGMANVEKMKRLAVSGQGLNSFINSYVKKSYAAKLR